MKKLLAGVAALAATLIAIPAGTGAAQTSADIMLLHGIPGVPVDVVVDGDIVIPNFQPGDMQDLSSFAGQTLTNLEVRAAGTTDVAIGPVASFDVPASGSWTVVAHLDADGTPTLTPFENDTSAVAAGEGRLIVRHTAAAPAVDIVLGDTRPVENDTSAVGAGEGRLIVRHTAAAPAVDIVLGDTRPVENLSNPNEASLVLPAGEIAGAQVAPTGGDPIADVPTVNLKAGTDLIVYAVGSLSDDTFTFYTQEVALAAADAPAGGGDGTPAPTAVNTGGPLDSSTNATTLFAAAAGLLVLAGGAFALRRRTVEA